MKRERLIILLGALFTLVFFYLGLKEWLRTKEERVQPPPLVVQPLPQREESPQAQQLPAFAELEPKAEVKKQEEKQEIEETPKTKEQDVIAQKIREEKRIEPSQKAQEERANEKPRKVRESREVAKATLKTYTVQIGAFVNEEGAKKTAERARKMGYRVNIVEEDNFYKVRILVKTGNIDSELRKLREIFGGAIIKQ